MKNKISLSGRILCLPLIAAMLFLFSCSSEDEAVEQTGDNSFPDESAMTNDESKAVKKVGKVFYTIPSPLETSMLLKKAGATFDKELVNTFDNAKNYITHSAMALNLGIYGADLSYSSIFEQSQETMRYFAVCKKLADELGITAAFGKETLDRIEKNVNNRDSLVNIIADSYWETDAYLKENNRSGVAALVIAGGWVEALYLATKISGKIKDNSQIVSRIGEQKLTLTNLIAMLETNNDADVSKMLENLYELRKIFDGVDMSYERGEPSTNPETKVTTINTTSKITISPELVKQISEKIEIVRNNIVY